MKKMADFNNHSSDIKHKTSVFSFSHRLNVEPFSNFTKNVDFVIRKPKIKNQNISNLKINKSKILRRAHIHTHVHVVMYIVHTCMYNAAHSYMYNVTHSLLHIALYSIVFKAQLFECLGMQLRFQRDHQ
jgi:hypothetical protein